MAQEVPLVSNHHLYMRLRGFGGSNRLGAPLALWALSMGLSALVCHDRGAALWVAFMMASGVIAFLLASKYPSAAGAVLRMVGLIGAVIISLSILLHGPGRPDWINPNWLSSLLLVTAPWAGWVALPGIMATGSRGAMLALGVAVLALILWGYIRKGAKHAALFAVIAVLAVAVATVLAIAMRPETVVDRLQTWRMACELWLVHPLLGHGPGASLLLLGENHADSLLLTVLMEQGALGLLAVCWVGVVILRMAFGPQGNPARLALLALGLHNLIDATLYMPGVAMLGGAALGILSAHQETHETK